MAENAMRRRAAPPSSSSRRVDRLRAGKKHLAWLSHLVTLFLVVILLGSLFVGYGLINNRWYHILVIEGGSMEPTLHWGDALVITRPPDELKPGMIVTMSVEGKLVTHRVISVDPLVTKGDANSSPDHWRPEQIKVVGVVAFRLPKLGWALERLRLAAGASSNAFFASSDSVVGGVEAAAVFSSSDDSGLDNTEHNAPADGLTSKPESDLEAYPDVGPVLVEDGSWTVIVSIFADESQALQLGADLDRDGFSPTVLDSSYFPDLPSDRWTVCLGGFPGRAEAELFAQYLQELGYLDSRQAQLTVPQEGGASLSPETEPAAPESGNVTPEEPIHDLLIPGESQPQPPEDPIAAVS
ncbi:MAG TPA: signal peptidase I [Thermoleophilia bacterium]|nr:signal peptidase I [Thermoleophilia bacterium]